MYGLAFNVFVYVGYIKSIPKELEEAAIVDGASPWQVFWKVIFPLLAPMIIVYILAQKWIISGVTKGAIK